MKTRKFYCYGFERRLDRLFLDIQKFTVQVGARVWLSDGKDITTCMFDMYEELGVCCVLRGFTVFYADLAAWVVAYKERV
jgi:hypothetical protein